MNESITLHETSWDKIIDVLGALNNPTADAMATTIAAQRDGRAIGPDPGEKEEPLVGVGFAGLPGSGKSTASKRLADTLDCPRISMGDAIRTEFQKEYQRPAASSELGEFAANARDEDAAQIPEWVTDLCEAETEATTFMIDGVRSVTDYEVLNDYFDEFTVVFIAADARTRLRRVQDRGREGEDDFTAGDLDDRDEHELQNLGLAGLLNYDDDHLTEYLPDTDHIRYNTGLVDYTIENVQDLRNLDAALESLAETLGLIDREDPQWTPA